MRNKLSSNVNEMRSMPLGYSEALNNKFVANDKNQLQKKKDSNSDKTSFPFVSNQDALADYIELFVSNPNKDMLSYAYMVDNSCYNDLLLNNSGYYLFRDETRIIKENAEIFRQYLKGISDIVEIGPGSDHALINKTIPILNYATNLTHYHAVDISENYLQKIAEFCKSNTDYVITTTVADLLKGKIITPRMDKPKAILFLGSTLGNFDELGQNKCLEQISSLANKGDKLILTFDINHDELSLMQAYENQYLWNFVLNIFRFYSELNKDFARFMKYFKVQSSWNKSLETVEIDFIATESFKFTIGDYRIVEVSNGQRFKIVKSRKFNIDKISQIVFNAGFMIDKNLCCDGKMNVIIAEKL